ncbi:Cyclin-A2, partial [Linderina macrospora]
MPSSNKENTLAADVPQHSYNMRKRVRTDHVDTGVSKDGCFVETAKRAIKRGCTELGIKKYASLSSMNDAHAQPLTTKHHTYSGRRLTRAHKRSAYSSADLSSEATVIVLPSEEDSLQEEEEEEEEVAVKAGARGVCRLESQMTMVEGSSSPLGIFEQLDIPETQETVSEKKLIELSRLSDKELADTYAPLCEWMLEIEAKHASKLTFGMERHPDLSSRMRPILIDWLMEVAADYCMHRQTLHLTVQYLDRFLAHTTLR